MLDCVVSFHETGRVKQTDSGSARKLIFQRNLEDFSDVWFAALEGSGTGIWDRDLVTDEIRYSSSWFSIIGYGGTPPSNHIAESYDRVHPDDLDYVKAQMQAHFERETPIYEVKHRIRCKDGSYKWVLSRGKVIKRDAEGQTLRMVGTTTDISVLKESEENYHHMVELFPEVPWVATPEGYVVDIGPQWAAMTGKKQKTFAAEIWIDSILPQDRDRVDQAWKNSIRTGDRFDVEYRLRQADGSYAWVRSRAAARWSEDGQIMRWYGTLEDISGRRVAEDARRNSEDLAFRVLETTGDAVILCNRSGKITFSNSKAISLLGQDAGLVGACVKELFTDTKHHKISRAIERAIDVGQSVHFKSLWSRDNLCFDVRIYVGSDDISVFIRDISEQHVAEQNLHYAASHDLMTGAINRTSLFEKLSGSLAGQEPGDIIALFCIDIDYFKEINDKHGHPAGDKLLREIVDRLLLHVSRHDLLARSGGDEFLIMQPAKTITAVTQLAERLNGAMKEAFDVEGVLVKISLSIGIAISSSSDNHIDRLYQQADRALYRAKKNARGSYQLFHPEIQTEIDRTSLFHMDLSLALERNEFFLEFQPIIHLSKRCIVGVEALIRWCHPERGTVSPAEFIPAAEETGLIVELGTWVLQHACEAALLWPEGVNVSVNVSARQFELCDVFSMVSDVLRDSGLPAKRLKLEVTESLPLFRNSPNLQTLKNLRDLNVTLVLDDFGTGFSSLSYLDVFKFDFIKIDKSFLDRIQNAGDRHPVFEAVMGMAKALELPVTAEGIERAAQLEYVQSLGCDFVQGYYFARPMPNGELIRFMSSPLAMLTGTEP